MENDLKLEVARAKALNALCDERGITLITDGEIDEIAKNEDIDLIDRLRKLKQLAKHLHEILYAPPNRG